MADHIYDLIIIGAGPAGYTAALRAAAMGMDAVLIEKKALGGSCVNTGCIPAKALLQATAVYRDMLKAFRFGIVAEKVSFDWRQMQIYKNESVESFRSMIQGMLEKAEVEMIHGDARLHADNVVRVTTSKGALTLKGKNVILATGSSPVIPDIPGIDLPQVMTSRDILRMDDWNFDCHRRRCHRCGDRDDLRGARFPRDAFGAGKSSAGVDGSDDFRADGSKSAF